MFCLSVQLMPFEIYGTNPPSAQEYLYNSSDLIYPASNRIEISNLNADVAIVRIQKSNLDGSTRSLTLCEVEIYERKLILSWTFYLYFG